VYKVECDVAQKPYKVVYKMECDVAQKPYKVVYKMECKFPQYQNTCVPTLSMAAQPNWVQVQRWSSLRKWLLLNSELPSWLLEGRPARSQLGQARCFAFDFICKQLPTAGACLDELQVHPVWGPFHQWGKPRCVLRANRVVIQHLNHQSRAL
jgi:hypothetical protein